MTCKVKKSKTKIKVTCTVRFVAAKSTRSLVGRLVHGKRVYASARRRVRPGGGGSLHLHARRRIQAGHYTLVLTFLDAHRRPTVIRQPVTVTR